MQLYNVGRIDQLHIVYVFKCKKLKEVETCIKKNLESYRVKKHKNSELFKIDDDFIKDTIIYCNKKTTKLKENKKLLNSKKAMNWLIIIDKKNINMTELYKPVKKYIRKIEDNVNQKINKKDKVSKKPSKKPSKKLSKKTSNKT